MANRPTVVIDRNNGARFVTHYGEREAYHAWAWKHLYRRVRAVFAARTVH